MPDKIDIVIDAKNLKDFWDGIKSIVAKYAATLKQPATKQEMLTFEDIPSIDIRPTSINENKNKYNTKEKKNRNAVGPLVGPIKNEDPQLIEHGSKLR